MTQQGRQDYMLSSGGSCEHAAQAGRLPVRHEQKDCCLASDEGVAERFLALGMGLGRSPFKVQKEKRALNTGFYT